MDRLADFRRVFASVVTARADCQDPAIRQALRDIPRHQFFEPGPWQFTEQSEPALLYQDVSLGLLPERGITSGLPSLHARCMSACAIGAGEKIIHIGAGSGYFTALLAELVGSAGKVLAFELDEVLAKRAVKNLRAWPWVQVSQGSGLAVERTEADLIYVSAGVEHVPHTWLASLRPAGRLLFPLVPSGSEGAILLVRNIGSPSMFSAQAVCSARFVPCVGAQNEAEREPLLEAFRARSPHSIRALRVQPVEADDSVWFSGRGWWLSTRTS